MKKKKLILISGITGSIGQEVLRKYLLEENTLIYGISRRGIPIDQLAFLPTHHLIVNVDLANSADIRSFVAKIPTLTYESITYFHLVGEFKTEINKNMKVSIENDYDNDGIDDCVYSLVTKAYKDMVIELFASSISNLAEINVVSLGSLADRYSIDCFTSYRKARAEVITFSEKAAYEHKNTNFYLFNTSTILAADEMLERPFIFSTQVKPQYWIPPSKLIEKMFEYMDNKKGYVAEDIYLPHPNFKEDYFTNTNTYKRRIKELYNADI